MHQVDEHVGIGDNNDLRLSLRWSQSGYVVIQAGILDEAVKFVRSEVHHGRQLSELATGDFLAAIRLEGETEEAMVEFVPDDSIIGLGKTEQLGKLATPINSY